MPSSKTTAKKSNRGRRPYGMTLCWDCRNATDPAKCPWVGKWEPVDGWDAKPTLLKIPGCIEPVQSFHVISCPLFDRDSYKGGLEENVFGKRKESISLDDKDIVNIAKAICERAVRDWAILEYGALKTVCTDGVQIDRFSVLSFFFSRWFTDLLETFSYHTPEQIRRYIKITDDMNPNRKGVAKG